MCFATTSSVDANYSLKQETALSTQHTARSFPPPVPRWGTPRCGEGAATAGVNPERGRRRAFCLCAVCWCLLDLDAHREPFAGRDHRGPESSALSEHFVELAHRDRAGAAAVHDLAERERVVAEDDAADPEVIGGPGKIGGIGLLVGVDEHEVERPVLLAIRQPLERGPHVDADAVEDAGLPGGLAGALRVASM